MSAHNLLVISDLHLGEDLNDAPHPSADDPASTVGQTERALVAFLTHYTAFRERGLPWQLICNGDMVDFLSVALSPEEAGLEGTEDDLQFGFGPHLDAARAKLARVLERHRPFFVAMARFLSRGNSVAVVVGNHDAEFHWDDVQADLRSALDVAWQDETRSMDTVSERVTFHPWFFHEPGVMWVEHGHQYDAFCSFEDPLAPEDPDQPRSLEQNLGTAAMRYLGNHLPVNPDSTADLSFVEYLQLLVKVGERDADRVLGGYAAVVRALGAQWWSRVRNRDRYKERRDARRARMAEIAAGTNLEASTLEKLHKLRKPPVFTDLMALVRSVMLGRLVITAIFVAVAPYLFYALGLWTGLYALLIGLVGMAVLHIWLAAGRDNVDPTEHMRRVAAKIRRLTRAPIVVFGHSHVPLGQRLGLDGWYFNIGAWAGGSERPNAFTHLVVRREGGKVRSALCRWHAGGSRELRSEVSAIGRGAARPGLSTGY